MDSVMEQESGDRTQKERQYKGPSHRSLSKEACDVAKIEGQACSHHVEYPPAGFISQEIADHITSIANDRLHTPPIWL
jgi:hypothetical protein